MAGSGHDRLSELPDDLLRRILHFVPLKEAATTTVLSRRWREPLCLSSGAVNLVTGKGHWYDCHRFFTRREDFVSGATAALDAADVPITRVTLNLDTDLQEPSGHNDFATWYRDHVSLNKIVSRYTDLVDVALSHRAVHGVEELRIAAKDPDNYYRCGPDQSQRGLYTVTFDSMQMETLQVLELTRCKGLLYQREQAAAMALPRLYSLWLSYCVQQLSSLQRVINAAPALAAIRLQSVLIDATDEEDKENITRHLRCPAATLLVLDHCTWEEKQGILAPVYPYKNTVDSVVEIDVPRLRSFRYKGLLSSFSFSPQPLELKLVDLEFSGHCHNGKNRDPDRDLATFWRFAFGFASTKEMRLSVNHLENIVVLGEARRVKILPTFHRLERLEVQGGHSTKNKAKAMMILNLLHCCQLLIALRINLNAVHQDNDSNEKGVPATQIPREEIQIAALLATRHLFQCLKSSLRRLGLQFRIEKLNCLGVQLIKFFAENAMTLEEMYIDGGDEKFCEQMNPKTEKWNSKRRKSGATSFVVLPLKRHQCLNPVVFWGGVTDAHIGTNVSIHAESFFIRYRHGGHTSLTVRAPALAKLETGLYFGQLQLKHNTIQLLQECRPIHGHTLRVNPEVMELPGEEEDAMTEIPQLPGVRNMTAEFCAKNSHKLGATMTRVLARCSNLEYFHLDNLIYLYDSPCEEGCGDCNLRGTWKDDVISLEHLREVKLSGFSGQVHCCLNMLQLLLVSAPILERMIVTATSFIEGRCRPKSMLAESLESSLPRGRGKWTACHAANAIGISEYEWTQDLLDAGDEFNS